MSRLKSLFSRRRKKIGIGVPEKYNGLYNFNYDTIIRDSLQKEEELIGCEKSNTLFLEGDAKTDSFGFIFTGKKGCEILLIMKDRITNNFPETLTIANQTDFDAINMKLPFLELPINPITKQTFSRGIKWFESNEVSFKGYIERTFRDVSFIFIVLDHDAFNFGAVSKIIEMLKEKEIKAVLILTFPTLIQDSIEKEKIDSNFTDMISTLSFIQYLMIEDIKQSLPFILIDEAKLVKNNSLDFPLNALQEKMNYRIANILIDLMIGTQNPSEFYKIDFGNFLRLFENAKGLCNLVSLDIYDNNPLLSGILEQKKMQEDFALLDKPTRGYILIQPGPEGLAAESYHQIRKHYSNLDVVLSIQKRRNHGAVIRGVLTYLNLPKQLLNRYTILSEAIIELLDEDNNVIGYLDTAKIEDLWIHENIRIHRILKEEKKIDK